MVWLISCASTYLSTSRLPRAIPPFHYIFWGDRADRVTGETVNYVTVDYITQALKYVYKKETSVERNCLRTDRLTNIPPALNQSHAGQTTLVIVVVRVLTRGPGASVTCGGIVVIIDEASCPSPWLATDKVGVGILSRVTGWE